MTGTLDPLILELLGWLSYAPHPYAEVMDAWRTSCPRLAVWEEAVDRGLVRRIRSAGGLVSIDLTQAGRAILAEGRPVLPDICVSAANL